MSAPVPGNASLPVRPGRAASFIAVARHRSFAAAARHLGVSTSALSQSVRQLEARRGRVAHADALHGIRPEITKIPMPRIDDAWAKVVSRDARYRFVIDMTNA